MSLSCPAFWALGTCGTEEVSDITGLVKEIQVFKKSVNSMS